LAGEASYTDAEREALVAKARPLLKAFYAGWFASRVTPAAEPPTNGVVHWPMHDLARELRRLAIKTTRWDRFVVTDVAAQALYRPPPVVTSGPRLLDERTFITSLSNELEVEARIAIHHDLSPAGFRRVRRRVSWQSRRIYIPGFVNRNGSWETGGTSPHACEGIDPIRIGGRKRVSLGSTRLTINVGTWDAYSPVHRILKYHTRED
jgi:hypothetical protein